MIIVGQELVLGMFSGQLQAFDIKSLQTTNYKQFGRQIGSIFDMIQIVDSQYLLLAGERGILKATKKGQVIKNYFKNQVNTICHIDGSLYLVGLYSHGLKIWDEQTDQEMFEICKDTVFSIKRILNSNSYIIKTYKNGIKLLTIKNLKTS